MYAPTERDYLHHTTRQLQRLAEDLKATKLTIAELSRLTGMNWDTVYKAMNRRPVRFDNAERLRYFVKRWQETHPDTGVQYTSKTFTTTVSPTKQSQPTKHAQPRGKGGRFIKKEASK